MEKKEIQEWRDRLIKMFGIYHSDGQEYVTCPLCGINLDELSSHMIKELDRAREEGFRNCYKEVLAMDSFGERMDMSRKESFRRLKNLLEDKIRLKLTTK